jgi:hypothetical protein
MGTQYRCEPVGSDDDWRNGSALLARIAAIAATYGRQPCSDSGRNEQRPFGTNGLPGNREAVRASTLPLVVQQPKHWSGELLAMTLLANVNGSFSR